MLQKFAPKEDLLAYINYIEKWTIPFNEQPPTFDYWANQYYGEEGVPYQPEIHPPKPIEEDDLPFN